MSRAGVLGRCPVERQKIPLIPRASRVVAALTGAHRGSKRRAKLLITSFKKRT